MGIVGFNASNGWLQGWILRYYIGKSVKLHGEAADIDLAEAETKMNVVWQKLAEFRYKPENIFNMDETGLLYRCLPNRSYVLKSDDERQIERGKKEMTAKERLTLALCLNAKGTCKISPLLVGTSKQPHYFRNGNKCLIPYVNQKNAWVDKVVYKYWWERVLLLEIRGFTHEKVALIMDARCRCRCSRCCSRQRNKTFV